MPVCQVVGVIHPNLTGEMAANLCQLTSNFFMKTWFLGKTVRSRGFEAQCWREGTQRQWCNAGVESMVL